MRTLALRVGILDRDRGFVTALAARLRAAGWPPVAVDPGALPRHLVEDDLDVLMLDPDAIGGRHLDWLEQAALHLPQTTVIVCALGASVHERIAGLRAGADDWVPKPCHPDEVVARVEARRRPRSGVPTSLAAPLRAGELTIDPACRSVAAAGASVALTDRELALLCALAAGEGAVVAREELFARVWGHAMARGDRSVDVYVRRLRRKLDAASPGWRYIHTRFGTGYAFAAEPVAPVAPNAPAERPVTALAVAA